LVGSAFLVIPVDLIVEPLLEVLRFSDCHHKLLCRSAR
jgi:hypothetical protein